MALSPSKPGWGTLGQPQLQAQDSSTCPSDPFPHTCPSQQAFPEGSIQTPVRTDSQEGEKDQKIPKGQEPPRSELPNASLGRHWDTSHRGLTQCHRAPSKYPDSDAGSSRSFPEEGFVAVGEQGSEKRVGRGSAYWGDEEAGAWSGAPGST